MQPAPIPISIPIEVRSNASATPPLVTRELSTLEAAKFLNASHLSVVQEIEAGRLKCRQVGVDLRIVMSDLVDYAVQTRLGG